MSYEEPAGPRRRRRRRRARPPRRRHEALPVRGRTDGPPGRDAEAPDGPGLGPIPEPRVHPEPRGPVRPRDDPRDGPRGEREGHPLRPVLPGRAPPGSRTRGGLAQGLTHANVGRRVDRHRPRYDWRGRPASRSPRSRGVDTGGRRGSVQRPGVGGAGARPRDLDRDRPHDRRPTAMGIVGSWTRGSLLVPHANGRPARPRRGACPSRRGVGRPIVRGPPRPAARRRSQREDRPRSSPSGPPAILKPVIGVAGFAASLGYLCYRLGRHAGYRWGTAASVAMARNIAEGRASAPATVVPRERAPTLPEPPAPRP